MFVGPFVIFFFSPCNHVFRSGDAAVPSTVVVFALRFPCYLVFVRVLLLLPLLSPSCSRGFIPAYIKRTQTVSTLGGQ